MVGDAGVGQSTQETTLFDPLHPVQQRFSFALIEAMNMLQFPGRAVAHRVGNPYVSHHGVRSVRVDNFQWTDDTVLEEAWWKEQSAAIAAGRPTPR